MSSPFVSLGARAYQGIYDLYSSTYTSTQIPVGRYPVGQMGITSDGRVFRYCRGGNTSGALAPGKVYITADPVANHLNCAVASGGGAAGQNVVSSITIGATALTVNQYAGGYLAVNAGTGVGQYWKIAKHASALSGATTVSVTLEDNIALALDNTSKVSFQKNKGDSPILAKTTGVNALCGVPLISITQETAASGSTLGTAYFAWFQTWGPCPVLAQGAIAIGSTAVMSSSVAGALMVDSQTAAAAQLTIVGNALMAGVDTEYRMVDLKIDPGY